MPLGLHRILVDIFHFLPHNILLKQRNGQGLFFEKLVMPILSGYLKMFQYGRVIQAQVIFDLLCYKFHHVAAYGTSTFLHAFARSSENGWA